MLTQTTVKSVFIYFRLVVGGKNELEVDLFLNESGFLTLRTSLAMQKVSVTFNVRRTSQSEKQTGLFSFHLYFTEIGASTVGEILGRDKTCSAAQNRS